MPVFNDELDNIYHTEGSRVVWSTTRKPALLFPDNALVLPSFTIAFPDFAKSNAYALDVTTGPSTQSGCASLASINPQEWDSGLTLVGNLPAQSNYFEVQLQMTRTFVPSTYMGMYFASALVNGGLHLLDGGSCEVERVGPCIRMVSFEKVGSQIFMRRKQSVTYGGQIVQWAPGNSQSTGSGGYQRGWTYIGDPNAWPAYVLDQRFGGNFAKRKGEANACSTADSSNYSSTYQGTVTITPGYIKL